MAYNAHDIIEQIVQTYKTKGNEQNIPKDFIRKELVARNLEASDYETHFKKDVEKTAKLLNVQKHVIIKDLNEILNLVINLRKNHDIGIKFLDVDVLKKLHFLFTKQQTKYNFLQIPEPIQFNQELVEQYYVFVWHQIVKMYINKLLHKELPFDQILFISRDVHEYFLKVDAFSFVRFQNVVNNGLQKIRNLTEFIKFYEIRSKEQNFMSYEQFNALNKFVENYATLIQNDLPSPVSQKQIINTISRFNEIYGGYVRSIIRLTCNNKQMIPCTAVSADSNSVQINDHGRYKFYQVFGALEKQTAIEKNIFESLDYGDILALKQNLVIFTYGYSGSGKTFTLFNQSHGVFHQLVQFLNNMGETFSISVSRVYGYIDSNGKQFQTISTSTGKVDNIPTNIVFGDWSPSEKSIEFIKETINNPESSRGYMILKLKLTQGIQISVIDMAGNENEQAFILKMQPTLQTEANKPKFVADFERSDRVLVRVLKILLDMTNRDKDILVDCSKLYNEFIQIVIPNDKKPIPITIKFNKFNELLFYTMLFTLGNNTGLLCDFVKDLKIKYKTNKNQLLDTWVSNIFADFTETIKIHLDKVITTVLYDQTTTKDDISGKTKSFLNELLGNLMTNNGSQGDIKNVSLILVLLTASFKKTSNFEIVFNQTSNNFSTIKQIIYNTVSPYLIEPNKGKYSKQPNIDVLIKKLAPEIADILYNNRKYVPSYVQRLVEEAKYINKVNKSLMEFLIAARSSTNTSKTTKNNEVLNQIGDLNKTCYVMLGHVRKEDDYVMKQGALQTLEYMGQISS